MRIVVNDIAASSGGALSILLDFYHYLKDNDSENEWIFLLGDNYIEETEHIKIIVLPEIKKSGYKKIVFDFFTGRKYIKSLHADLFLSMQNIIIFGLKIPKIVYIHQSIPFQSIKSFSLLKKSERKTAIYQHIIGKIIKLSAKKADKVIVQTKWMKNAVSEKAKISKNKIINILPNIDELSPYIKKNIDKKNKFFYPTADIIYKNNDCIYRACEILNKKGYYDFNVKLTINSDKKMSNIEFVGTIKREQVINEYNTSTLIFPSYIETFGYPMAEAKQIGAIVLASDCAFSREVLEGYKNAYFFNPFQSEELVNLMQKVINCEIKRNETLYITDMINSWSNVIEEVLNT